MSSYLEEMNDSADGIEAIFQEYLTTRDNHIEPVIYCFFEGKDYRYYGSRINAFSDKETIPYDCGGKENVLMLHGMITDNTSHDNNNIKLFFIDKDFDINKVQVADIYTTPCYAIENFYITDTAFVEFLKGELRINKYSHEGKEDFTKALQFFRENREEFIDKVKVLNAWYSLQRNKLKSEKDKPDLKRLKELKNLKIPLEIEKLKELTPDYVDVSEVELENEIKRLMKDPISNFRGKYFEEFLTKIIEKIITDSNKPSNIFSKRRHVNLAIGKDNIISILSQYADTPQCLRLYLSQMIVNNEVASGLDKS